MNHDFRLALVLLVCTRIGFHSTLTSHRGLYLVAGRAGAPFIAATARESAMLTIAAAVLIALGGFVSLGNGLALTGAFPRDRGTSVVPLVGAGLLGVGMLLLPATRPYAWLALVADLGTLVFLFGLPWIVPSMVGEWWSTHQRNLMFEYVGETESKTVRIRLFRNGVFTIQQHQRDGTALSMIGSWSSNAAELMLRLGEQTAVFEGSPTAGADVIRQRSGFSTFEESRDLSLAALELRLHRESA